MGNPPDVLIRDFTVQRESETSALIDVLERDPPKATLLHGNCGGGKTHLLRWLREEALQRGFAVSLVSLDSSSEVRFNRMDQVFAACVRNIQIPGRPRPHGIRALMEFLCEAIATAWHKDNSGFWKSMTSGWTWDSTELLESPSLYIALRAWYHGDTGIKAFVENWMSFPWNYYENRRDLYQKLVANLKDSFIDSRPASHFYNVRAYTFHFKDPQYRQSWSALRDVRILLREAGVKDLVLLFDGIDDIVDGLGNLKFQKIAFRNLLRFFSGADFPGMSIFASNNYFAQRCRTLLERRSSWSSEFSGLENLPSRQINPMNEQELQTLGKILVEAHDIAYGCKGSASKQLVPVQSLVERMSRSGAEDRTRQTIMAIVELLDKALEAAA